MRVYSTNCHACLCIAFCNHSSPLSLIINFTFWMPWFEQIIPYIFAIYILFFCLYYIRLVMHALFWTIAHLLPSLAHDLLQLLACNVCFILNHSMSNHWIQCLPYNSLLVNFFLTLYHIMSCYFFIIACLLCHISVLFWAITCL